MSVTIPLRLSPGADAPARAVPSRGLQLNFPLAIANQSLPRSIFSIGQRREEQVLRAVAAACVLSRPKRARELAEQAKNEPHEVLEPEIAEGSLETLMNPVVALIENRSQAPAATEDHRAIARAVGADATLVAVAHKVIERSNKDADKAEDTEKDGICEQGLKWVAAIDAELLGRGTETASRISQFKRVPPPQAKTVELNKRVDELDVEIASKTNEIRGDIDQIKERVEALEKGGHSEPETKSRSRKKP